MSDEETQRRLTELAIAHGIDPVVQREIRALLREAQSSGPDRARGNDADRYESLGALGRGGMGEVVRVRDPNLGRTVAMKAIRRDMAWDEVQVARFVAEAQTLSQLQHPGIVPIYELGTFDDGRTYFTMAEIRGRTLADRLIETQTEIPLAVFLRRQVDVLAQATEAIAYAHSRGVVHRDLKPENIMVGDFGEVFVVDWGIAKIVGRRDPSGDPVGTVRTERRESGVETKHGQVVGTPMYMAPEQAKGDQSIVGPPADVYALGAILFEILTGSRPRSGRTGAEVLRQAMRAEVLPIEGPYPIPDALAAAVRKAMSPEPEDRHPDARAFADALGAWLDGEAQREQALRLVEDADALRPGIDALREQARVLSDRARELLDSLPDDAPVADKIPAWDQEDEAREKLDRARAWEAEYTQALFDAVSQAPELDEAHDRLADYYHARHAEAELHGDNERAQHALARLRAHHRGRYARYIEGNSSVELALDPPDATIEIRPVRVVHRRLTAAEPLDPPPPAPLTLPHGRWLFVLRAAGRATVHLPLSLQREARWRHEGPDGAVRPIVLPEVGELGPDDVIVTGGWTSLGGDPLAIRGRREERVWIEGFVARRRPVTNAEWLTFIQHLIREGRAEEARDFSPQTTGATPYTWNARLPVRLVSRHAARAFAAWEAERTDRPWRLPTEAEWELAARGPDGPAFPFGDHLDPSWCHMGVGSPAGPAVVDDHPDDISPYGLYGMAGNVRDWCEGTLPGGLAPARGGAFSDPVAACRAASRHLLPPDRRHAVVGLRLVRDLVPEGW